MGDSSQENRKMHELAKCVLVTKVSAKAAECKWSLLGCIVAHQLSRSPEGVVPEVSRGMYVLLECPLYAVAVVCWRPALARY